MKQILEIGALTCYTITYGSMILFNNHYIIVYNVSDTN